MQVVNRLRYAAIRQQRQPASRSGNVRVRFIGNPFVKVARVRSSSLSRRVAGFTSTMVKRRRLAGSSFQLFAHFKRAGRFAEANPGPAMSSVSMAASS